MKWNDIDTAFRDDCTSNFPAYAEVIRHYSPGVVVRQCGIIVQDLETTAKYWGKAKSVLSM
jgi:ferredoxin-nitrate reductase